MRKARLSTSVATRVEQSQSLERRLMNYLKAGRSSLLIPHNLPLHRHYLECIGEFLNSFGSIKGSHRRTDRCRLACSFDPKRFFGLYNSEQRCGNSSRQGLVPHDTGSNGTLAVGCWIVLSYFLGLYFRHFAHFNKTYGTLGAAIALITWLYWTGFALLVGAELNCELARVSSPCKIEEKHEPPPLTRIDFAA
jgi:Virulence factor BrkB